MKNSNKLFIWNVLSLFLFSSLFMISFSNAQEYGMESDDGYNANSVRPVNESHIMFQKSLWHRVLLNQKQNQPFFAEDNEITKHIIDGVKRGIITPYRNDSLQTRMSQEDFLANIELPSEPVMICYDDMEDWGGDITGENNWGGNIAGEAEYLNEYYPKQLDILEIKTHVFFDKTRNRMINDIQSITIILPADLNPSTGLERPIATFSYKDLVQNLFRDNSSAIHYNERNRQGNLNLEEAFDLMLANGTLIKYANGRNEHIMDMYDDQREALLAAQNYQANMVEYESNLWEN